VRQVIFFIPYLSLTTNGTKAIDSVWGIGKLMFIAIIGVVSWEISLIARYWTWLFTLVWALSYAVTFPFLLALAALLQRFGYYDSSQVQRSTLPHSPSSFRLHALHMLASASSSILLGRNLLVVMLTRQQKFAAVCNSL
jgi:hypothetical protein